MYNIIPLILILVSLAVIIVIVVRKFSVLASLDIDSIQAEREAVFKEQIISKRIKRNVFKYNAKLSRVVKPALEAIGSFFKWSYERLLEFKENYNKEKKIEASIPERVEKLFVEVDELIKNEDYEKAEKKYIEIIGLDSKSIKAFKGLGKFYIDRKQYNEAKQTLEHALRLAEKEYNDEIITAETDSTDNEDKGASLSRIYYDIALANYSNEEAAEGLKNIEKALKIQPLNPRYLDMKAEMSIINKDKVSALDAYEKLTEANPDNQKLKVFKKQIDEL